MSIERARYYENLRRSNYRNEKEAFSLSLERAYEGNKPDPYQSDPATETVMETTTPPALMPETARPEAKPPPVEKQPISAIRAEVCRVANELRKSAGMSKSMAMRESWAMAKSGRAAFPVSGASIGAATKG